MHGRFEHESRIRDLRRRLHGQGLTVGVPMPLFGDEIVFVDGRVAEIETFVEPEKPAPTWDSYLWMYEAMGRLHRAIDRGAAGLELPVPEVATYASPAELRALIIRGVESVDDEDGACREP